MKNYETIPNHEIPLPVLQAVDRMKRFCEADLNMTLPPIRFVKQLGTFEARRHHGTEELSYSLGSWQGLADFKRGQGGEILLLLEHGKKPGDIAQTLAHEARHFHQRAQGWRAFDEEFDARYYGREALALSASFDGNPWQSTKRTWKDKPYTRENCPELPWHEKPKPAPAIDDFDAALKELEVKQAARAAKYGTRPKAGTIEKRSMTATLEKREAAGVGKIFATFVAYNSKSENLGGFYEIVKPGAFTDENLQRANVACLWSHDSSKPLGRVGNGTLKLWQDAQGVHGEVTLPDTQAGKDALELLKRGDVHNCSFGFRVSGERWQDGPDGIPIRLVTAAELLEVSLVTFPAYSSTSAGAREYSWTDY